MTEPLNRDPAWGGRPERGRRRPAATLPCLLGAGLLLLTACAPVSTMETTPLPGATPLLPATLPPSPSPTMPATPAPSMSPVALPTYQAGVNLLFYSDADYPAGLTALLTRLRADGVNSVAVTFPFYQASSTASGVGSGSGTPSDQQLTNLIRTLEGDGFSVMLRPLMDQGDLVSWRGAITPASVSEWFASYTALLSHYATMAASDHVQVFDVGSELYSLENYTADWEALIGTVRTLYPGALTYSANGPSETGGSFRDGFWKALDFVSVDAYWDLGVPDGTGVTGLAQAWRPYLAEMATAAGGLPVVLSEVGIVPQDGEQDHPWDALQPGPTDAAFQQTYYQAACQAASAASVAGIYWWEVNLGTPGDFDPLGAPAEQAIASCFAAAGA
jgi:hypothetical protein